MPRPIYEDNLLAGFTASLHYRPFSAVAVAHLFRFGSLSISGGIRFRSPVAVLDPSVRAESGGGIWTMAI